MFIEFQSYPTGRPCWIDPARVGAIMDTIEQVPSDFIGGDLARPTLRIVGTTLYVDGVPAHVQGDPQAVAAQIREALGQ